MKNKTLSILLARERANKKILERARKKKQIIYGARSIQAQIGIFSRPTTDWDIFTPNPKSEAQNIEKELDRNIGFDYYYTKKAKNPGTYKVKGKGFDLKKGTEDDEGIIDYTKTPSPRPKVRKIEGVLYRSLSQEKKAKKKTIRDPEFKFRKEKDQEDLARIRLAKGPF